jgi:hypothetical protein
MTVHKFDPGQTDDLIKEQLKDIASLDTVSFSLGLTLELFLFKVTKEHFASFPRSCPNQRYIQFENPSLFRFLILYAVS